MEKLSTILSHIKSSSAYVHDYASVARYMCPNDAKCVSDMDSQFPLERLIDEWRTLVEYFSALESYMRTHNAR